MSLLRTDAMRQGGIYRFKFQTDGFFSASDTQLRGRILSSGLPIAQVQVESTFLSNMESVTFIWNGIGWTVQQVIQNLEAKMSDGINGHFTFVSAEFLSMGNAGSVGQLPSAPSEKPFLDNIFGGLFGADSSTVFIIIAIVGVLALGFYGWGSSGFKGFKIPKL
jgi:hypothetical protein